MESCGEKAVVTILIKGSFEFLVNNTLFAESVCVF